MTPPPSPNAVGWLVLLHPAVNPLYPADGERRRPGASCLRLALKCLLRGFVLRCVSTAARLADRRV